MDNLIVQVTSIKNEYNKECCSECIRILSKDTINIKTRVAEKDFYNIIKVFKKYHIIEAKYITGV